MFLANEEWLRFFASFDRSAWRLELWPIYTVPQEQDAIARFRAGERLPPSHRSAWMDRVAGYVETGRTIGRVHVVRRPLSEYLKFEFEWYYRHHVKVGEGIRILDVTDQPANGLPDHDFWMFDDKHVVKMLYRPDGSQTGRDLIEQPDIASYVRYRDIAEARSVPFPQYLALHE
jgi:hypothetical protein